MARYYATQYFTGDGQTTRWNISFAGARPDNRSGTTAWFKDSDVKANTIVQHDDGTETESPLTVTVVGPTQVDIEPAVANGVQFRIYRESEREYPLVDFQDYSALTAAELDAAFRQTLFGVQELDDRVTRFTVDATTGKVLSIKAEKDAAIARQQSDEAKASAASSEQAASTAAEAARKAQAAAEASDASAIANTAAEANQIARDASKQANSAATTANSAKQTADGIASTAHDAVSKAEQAESVANAAKDTANASTQTANSAASTANSAKDTANAASTSAAKRVYQVNTLDAMAALPLDLVYDGFAVYVTDEGVGGTFTYREGGAPFFDSYRAVYVGSNGGKGYFVRETSNYIDIRWAGCKESASADFNTPRIQTCIELGKALGYDEVRIPAGVWSIRTLWFEHTHTGDSGIAKGHKIPPSLVGHSPDATWLRCFTNESDRDMGVLHCYMGDSSKHMHTNFRIKNMTIDGTTDRPAISFAGLIRAEVHNVTFEKCTAGILYHNRSGDNFTEYCVAVGCEFSWGCPTAIEYKVSNGVDSFHGSGMRDCIVNNNLEASTVIIGEGSLVYNAPLSFQVWKYKLNPLITCKSTIGGQNFHGTITSETFGSIGAWKVCQSVAGYPVVLVGSTSQLWRDMVLGDLVLAERNVTEWLDSNGRRESFAIRKPVSVEMTVPSGQNWQVAGINVRNSSDGSDPCGSANVTVRFDSNDGKYTYVGQWFISWGAGSTHAQLLAAPWKTWDAKADPYIAITSSGDFQVIMPDNDGYVARANINFTGVDKPVYTK